MISNHIHVHISVVLVHHVRPPLFRSPFSVSPHVFYVCFHKPVLLSRGFASPLRYGQTVLVYCPITFRFGSLFDNEHFIPVEKRANRRMDCNSFPMLGITRTCDPHVPRLKYARAREEIFRITMSEIRDEYAGVTVCGPQSWRALEDFTTRWPISRIFSRVY